MSTHPNDPFDELNDERMRSWWSDFLQWSRDTLPVFGTIALITFILGTLLFVLLGAGLNSESPGGAPAATPSSQATP